ALCERECAFFVFFPTAILELDNASWVSLCRSDYKSMLSPIQDLTQWYHAISFKVRHIVIAPFTAVNQEQRLTAQSAPYPRHRSRILPHPLIALRKAHSEGWRQDPQTLKSRRRKSQRNFSPDPPIGTSYGNVLKPSPLSTASSGRYKIQICYLS